MHMACAVGGRTEEADEEQEGKQEPQEGAGLTSATAAAGGADKAEGGDAVQEVTFLYKLAAGVCMWGDWLGGARVRGRWSGIIVKVLWFGGLRNCLIITHSSR